MSPAIRWHIITGEYPPQEGGVSDYSRTVARGLVTAGNIVKIYAPRSPQADRCDDGVIIHRLPGHFGIRALAQLSRSLGCNVDDRLLIQYVPHAFGFKGMNLPFCLWLRARTHIYGGAWVMFHEVNYESRPGDPIRYRIIEAMTKTMAGLVARSAARIFVSTPMWTLRLRPLAESRSIVWMPVPSTITVVNDPPRIARTRLRYAPLHSPIIGHFSSYPSSISAMLRIIVPRIAQTHPNFTILLIGNNSEAFRESLVQQNTELAAHVISTGTLPADEVSVAISCCDVMAQPYPEGVTSRRTSMMAALDHARAIVTTDGLFTESLWRESGAASLVRTFKVDDFLSEISDLVTNEIRRRSYADSAKVLYAKRFDLRHTIEALSRSKFD